VRRTLYRAVRARPGGRAGAIRSWVKRPAPARAWLAPSPGPSSAGSWRRPPRLAGAYRRRRAGGWRPCSPASDGQPPRCLLTSACLSVAPAAAVVRCWCSLTARPTGFSPLYRACAVLAAAWILVALQRAASHRGSSGRVPNRSRSPRWSAPRCLALPASGRRPGRRAGPSAHRSQGAQRDPRQANRLGESQAKMAERARIAGEMHDLIGHRLSLISLHAGRSGTGHQSPPRPS